MTQGELTVALHEARNLPVWGFYGQSNPYCRLTLGTQAVRSRSEDDTSHKGKHGAPVWNQEFQFLVEDAETQVWTSVGVGVGSAQEEGCDRYELQRYAGFVACRWEGAGVQAATW